VADLVPEPLLVGIYGIAVTPGMVRLVLDTRAAGICLLRRNIDSPPQVSELVARLEREVGRRLLVAVDHDGGSRSPFTRGVTFFPGFPALARTGNPDLAREAGRELGRELVEMGIELNLAPVSQLGALAEPFERGAAEAGMLSLRVSPDLSGTGGPADGEVGRVLEEGVDLGLLLHDEAAIRRWARRIAARGPAGGDTGRWKTVFGSLGARSRVSDPGDPGDAGEVARRIAGAAIHLERDPRKLIPLKPGRRMGVFVPRLAEIADRATIEDRLLSPIDFLKEEIPRGFAPLELREGPLEGSEAMDVLHLTWIRPPETVVVFLVDPEKFPSERRLLDRLERQSGEVVAVVMGEDPRPLAAGEATTVLRTWGFRSCQLSAAVRVLFAGAGGP
jgi:hypothetical protein